MVRIPKGHVMSQMPIREPNVNITTAVATPTDRVRWGPIIAGLFAALSTLAVLAVLGVAVAGSTYDPGDSARAFGIGAGIWSAISALIAFFVGGWLASRSAAVRSEGSGVLNGAMVWVVAVPLMLYMIIGGVGGLLGSAASTAGSTAAAGANAAAQQPDIQDRAQTASAKIQAATQQVTEQIKQPENQRAAARGTAKTAWGTLVSLLLGLAAAAFGGWVGSGMKHDNTHRTGRDRDLDRDTTTRNP
jgi:hypothetical protein